MLKEKIS